MALPTPREACAESVLSLCRDDSWLTRYALIKALEELDLHHLINLATDVADAAARDALDSHGRLRALLEERYQ